MMTPPNDTLASSRRPKTVKDMQFSPAPRRRFDGFRTSANIRIIRRDERPTRAPERPRHVPQEQPSFDVPMWLPEAPERMSLRRPARLKVFLVYSGIIALALLVGVSFFFQAIGQWVIIGAGIAGIFMRINSIVYFAAGLVALGIVVIMTIGGQEMMASNYAVYAYLLLAFGTFHSIINLQRPDPHFNPSR